MNIEPIKTYTAADFPGDITTCHQSGACDSYVAEYLNLYEIKADPAALRSYLYEFGAWDDEELLDHNANIGRLVWLIAGDLEENGVFYFCH